MTSMRVAPALWWTVAFNLLALLLAVALFAADVTVEGFSFAPLALAGTGMVGLVALARPRTRRLGLGCLVGTAVSAAIYALLLAVFFVTYFVIGGNELS